MELLNARNRHHLNLLDKLNNYEVRKQETEILRQKNRKEQQDRR